MFFLAVFFVFLLGNQNNTGKSVPDAPDIIKVNFVKIYL
jgi:hypothetical protein